MQRSIIAPAERVTNFRWLIALLLAAGVLVAEFIRINVAALASSTATSFGGVDARTFGLKLSWIILVYAVLQIPVGVLIDAYGSTRAGRLTAAAWCVLSLAAAAFSHSVALWGLRLSVLATSPVYPLASDETSAWFGRSERGLATAMLQAAGNIGLGAGLPLSIAITFARGWQATLILVAVLAALYLIAFSLIYRDPAGDSRLTFAERKHLTGDGARITAERSGEPLAMLWYILRQRKVWGLAGGFASYAYGFYFSIVATIDHVSRLGAAGIAGAWTAAVPWLAAAVADVLVAGVLVDALIRRGIDPTRVRLGVIVVGMLCAPALFAVTIAANPQMFVVYTTIGLCGLSCAATTSWTLPGLIAPHGAVGTVAGVMQFAAVLVTALAIPFIFSHAGSTIFWVAEILLLAGIVSYVLVLGRLEPIPDAIRG